MDSEGFEFHVLWYAYPFFEEEFPYHVKKYRDIFK